MHQLASHPEMNRNTISHLMLKNREKLLFYGPLGSNKLNHFSQLHTSCPLDYQNTDIAEMLYSCSQLTISSYFHMGLMNPRFNPGALQNIKTLKALLFLN